jgi:RTX calcium-binding nonapeptide repeat (4 copies)
MGLPILLEPLSARLCLSATLSDNTLTIDGTPGDDAVIVAADKRFINVLTVSVDDELSHFSLLAFTNIKITTGDGDDKIWIDSSLDPMAYPSTIDAGSGNDSITTSAGKDVITAGEGNDKVYSNGGDDSLVGGNGRDLLDGGSGNDTILGNAHNDRIFGEGGADLIYPGKGNDYTDGGYDDPGKSIIIDSGGTETIVGSADDDYIQFENGTVWGGDGNDDLLGLGVASLYGQAGNDKLYGIYCEGGDGADTLTGTPAADALYGGADDDLIKGNGGPDLVAGGDGNDALFGGSDNDSVWGGDGNDNLYGNDGAKDKNHDDDGRDVGYGQGGADWWQPDIDWADTDHSGSDDRTRSQQNPLSQDPSYPYYSSGSFGYSGSITTGRFSPPATIAIETKSLGPAGWLSSGAWDTTSSKFVPPPESQKARRAVGRMIVQIPAGWQVGEMSFARDEIVWYRVSGPATLPPGERSAGRTYRTTSGTDVFIPMENEVFATVVPTLDDATIVAVPNTTPGLLDGVPNGKYRFLGVRRGTVLIGGDGSAVDDVQTSVLSTALLPTNSTMVLRLAGHDDRTYTPPADVIDSLPPAGPKLKGILVEGGAIWLPTDGSEPYFSSGTH